MEAERYNYNVYWCYLYPIGIRCLFGGEMKTLEEIDEMIFTEFIAQHMGHSGEFLKGARACYEWIILRGEWEECRR